MAFVEYQLYPSLIGLSPLITTHPRLLQQPRVRPSNASHCTFSLVITRSLGFGSNATNYVRRHLKLAFALPTPNGLSTLVTLTRWFIIQKARSHHHNPYYIFRASTEDTEERGLLLFVSTQFQGLFHSPNRGSFHLSFTVLVHYRLPGST